MGSGKETTALYLAAALLGLTDSSELAKYPYVSILNPSTPAITIDEVRAAQNLLVLKVPAGKTAIRRIIIVIDAERMRSEAQNAFLKTLEEPPLDTCIILTASSEKLLPTITSRIQKINILPVSETQAQDFYIKRGIPSQTLRKNYALSQGHAGLLSALLRAEDHILGTWVQTAKEILSETPASRVLRVEALSKNKDEIRLLLDALGRISHSALLQSASQNKQQAITRWLRTQQAVQDSITALSFNASTKLVLDSLFINL
jgi:DNA polymerase-3 subunit delta'